MDLATMILACSLYANNSTVNAIIQLGSQNNPLTISILNAEGENTIRTFKSAEQAAQAAAEYIKQEQAIEIGLLQIPSFWLEKYPTNLKELFLPCKNMAVATNIIHQATYDECSGSEVNNKKSCALSVYKSGSTTDGLTYASQILDYARKHPFRKPVGSEPTATTATKTTTTETTKPEALATDDMTASDLNADEAIKNNTSTTDELSNQAPDATAIESENLNGAEQ